MPKPTGHGWWPYVLPYVAFLVLVEIQARLPDAAAAWMLPLKVALPALLVLGFLRRGAYPELRGLRPGPGLLLDAAVGLGVAVLWVGPFLLWEGLPRGDSRFEPAQLGSDWRAPTLGLRLMGFGIVTPVVEELFVRSFLLRLIDVLWDRRGDFRRLPIGRFRWPSLVGTTLWFTFSHLPWEWIVAAPAGIVFTLWLYHRGHIVAPIVAHAIANGAIWALVVCGPWDLWEFL